jgi:hypothetical protein
MQLREGLAFWSSRHALPLGRMSDGIDPRMDPTAVPGGMGGERRVLAHVSMPVPEHHGLESRIAGFRPHGFMDQGSQRLQENMLERRIRHLASGHHFATPLDRHRERRRGAGLPLVDKRCGIRRQEISTGH